MISKQEIAQIDPAIRDLMKDINNLEFVDKTMVSCSGHVDDKGNLLKDRPYFAVKYMPEQHERAKEFHRDLKRINGFAFDVQASGYSMFNRDPYTGKKITPETNFTPSLDYLTNDIGTENLELVFEKNKNFGVYGEGPICFLRDGKPAASYEIIIDKNLSPKPAHTLMQAWNCIDGVVSGYNGGKMKDNDYFEGFNPDGSYGGKFLSRNSEN